MIKLLNNTRSQVLNPVFKLNSTKMKVLYGC
jgi:hypothetical protein